MIPGPTGATRLYVIVGDPIAQVRSPAGVSAAFAARGHDGILMPANATPAGTKEGDPLPVDVARLAPHSYCGCVITKPEIPPFIAAAREAGCVTGTGTDMYEQHQGIMVDFLLHRDG